jgi:hypothetical protein
MSALGQLMSALGQLMSALGHKQTCVSQKVMSAYSPKQTCDAQRPMSALGQKRTLLNIHRHVHRWPVKPGCRSDVDLECGRVILLHRLSADSVREMLCHVQVRAA